MISSAIVPHSEPNAKLLPRTKKHEGKPRVFTLQKNSLKDLISSLFSSGHEFLLATQRL